MTEQPTINNYALLNHNLFPHNSNDIPISNNNLESMDNIQNNIHNNNRYNNTSKHHLKIATLNVHELTTLKALTLQEIIEKKKIDIMALTETNKHDKNMRYLFHRQNQYLHIFHNENDSPKGKGVSLLITKTLSRYICSTKTYKGRVLTIDLLFRKQKSLRIITYYGLANTRSQHDKEESVDIKNHVIKEIQEGKKFLSEVILLGDFNAHYDKYQQNIARGITQGFDTNIFEYIEKKYNMFDPFQIIYDISLSKPQYTFFAYRDGKEIKSRIDYI